MRVNIYSEEITGRIVLVHKSAEGRDFIGLRFYLLSHENMTPPLHPDDDSSAVTFWFDGPGRLALFVANVEAAQLGSR